MRTTYVAGVLTLWMVSVGAAQVEEKAAAPSADRAAGAAAASLPDLKLYEVELVEIQIKDSKRLAARQLLDALPELQKQGNVALRESVRLSVVTSYEASVHFGKSINVTTATTQTQFGRQRSVTERRVGTIAQITVEPIGEDLLLRLSYEASRQGDKPEGDDPLPPDVVSTQVKTHLRVQTGKSELVSCTSFQDGISTYLIVTAIEASPRSK